MHLLIVILILIAWAIYGIIKSATPQDPPIDDINEYCRKISNCRGKAEARQFIKQDAIRRRKLIQENNNND